MIKNGMRIGIRREDRSKWERRAPLVPDDVAWMKEKHGIHTVVQPSRHPYIRIFSEDEYRRSGAEIEEDLSSCPVIFAIKEIPIDFIQQGKTYVFFSHTIKGQSKNMPLLQRLMEYKCQLIDYERIVTDDNRRLVYFGQYAGFAGMADTLWALGQRLKIEGIDNPFVALQPAHHYESVERIKEVMADVGAKISSGGIPADIAPLVIGFAGYGNVSRGAQSIIEPLPLVEVSPADLAHYGTTKLNDPTKVYKVVFKEEDTVIARDPGVKFSFEEYVRHPEKFRSRFDDYTPHLSVLVNGIFWNDKCPRLITKGFLKTLFSGARLPRLKVIGDISCDVGGSIEATLKCTDPETPVYVYDPVGDLAVDGFAGRGVVMMTVDILPCELPRGASKQFSEFLRPFVPEIATADYTGRFASCGLSAEVKRAMIVYQGELTPEYQYLRKYVR